MGKSQALQMSVHAAVSSTSLIALTCDNTLSNEKYEKVKKTVLKLHKDVLEYNKKLLILEADYSSIQKHRVAKHADELNADMSSSFKRIPHQNGGEDVIKKNETTKVEKDNLKKAIKISLEVRKVAQAIEKIGYRLTKIGDKNMHADARTAIHLAHASSKSALENIKVVKKELAKI